MQTSAYGYILLAVPYPGHAVESRYSEGGAWSGNLCQQSEQAPHCLMYHRCQAISLILGAHKGCGFSSRLEVFHSMPCGKARLLGVPGGEQSTIILSPAAWVRVPFGGNRDATSHVAQLKNKKCSKASKHPETCQFH